MAGFVAGVFFWVCGGLGTDVWVVCWVTDLNDLSEVGRALVWFVI